MTPEWLSAIVAIIAAVVAGVAAIVAYSQAISAKRQADSSEESVRLAADQVTIAERAARSAEAQASEARRSNDAAARIALSKAIGALDGYGAALGAMMQVVTVLHFTKEVPKKEWRSFVKSAQTGRSDIMALLEDKDWLKRWMGFEARFDALSLFLAEKEEGSSTSDASMIRLSFKFPGQSVHVEPLQAAADSWGDILAIRTYIEDQIHDALR